MIRVASRRWNLPPRRREAAVALAELLDLSPIMGEILLNRGIDSPEAARSWLAPAAHAIPDPDSIAGLRKAADRLRAAKKKSESVLIYGDYDVDGIAATALMARALWRFGIEDLRFAIPERESEGYGIGAEQVRQAHAEGVRVLLTVDNGITAHDAADTARALGIDLIVTDHHEPGDALPKTFACVNPKCDNPDHGLSHISGAAVAWMLAAALLDDAEDLLGYVALGTVADVMPLHGVNRSLTARGLAALRGGGCTGVNALCAATKINIRHLRAGDVAFRLAPRINAAGRMGNAAASLDLLLSDSYRDAVELCGYLEEANRARKDIEQRIFDEASRRAADGDQDVCIVQGSTEWPRGIVGIVAARLSEAHNKPAFVFSFADDGVAYGSARSPAGYNLVETLHKASAHTLRYGGHERAAGLAMLQTEFDGFETTLRGAFADGYVEAAPQTLDIDAVVAFSEVGWRLLDDLALFEPCGSGNPEPLLCAAGVEIPSNSVREFRGGHLGCQCLHGGKLFRAVGFSMADRIPGLRAHPGTFDIVFRAVRNEFRGETSIQLQLTDIRPAEDPTENYG